MAEILVLEDDESMNDILVRSLAGMGHQARAALNADRALELCLSHDFDLVVTDVILPGQDGIECLAQIKSLQADVSCIVITGYARDEIPERAILLKVDDYLLKPFSMKSFLTAVTEVLDPENDRIKRDRLLVELFSDHVTEPSDDVEDMCHRRRDTIRALYVGARSRLLTRAKAKIAYLRIEAVEETFRKILMKRLSAPEIVTKTRALYAEIYQSIVYPRGGDVEQEALLANLPEQQFGKLHDRLLTSELSLHDLEYAPLLRRISDSRLQSVPPLLNLKKRLWA